LNKPFPIYAEGIGLSTKMDWQVSRIFIVIFLTRRWSSVKCELIHPNKLASHLHIKQSDFYVRRSPTSIIYVQIHAVFYFPGGKGRAERG
jgi:hypothetical protein